MRRIVHANPRKNRQRSLRCGIGGAYKNRVRMCFGVPRERSAAAGTVTKSLYHSAPAAPMSTRGDQAEPAYANRLRAFVNA
jgi:hypothetical protein